MMGGADARGHTHSALFAVPKYPSSKPHIIGAVRSSPAFFVAALTLVA